ncbi:hypothetical protein [Xanthobacter versatilis]|uniref:hypothetical protein n=1 Tax=Xanthobacter autotrophicus (strain ATCC BAA-1158 / Py2) TaxID=78245 RepID=UPI00372A4BE4
MTDGWMTGLKRLIAMVCMAVACLSPVRAISALGPDLDHALDLAHAEAAGEDIVHYCETLSDACERQPHEGNAGTAPHHHHGDPFSGFVAVSSPPFALPRPMRGLELSTHRSMGRGLGPVTPERPPKA